MNLKTVQSVNSEVEMTKQRRAVLEVIRREKRHYTAEEIFALARLILPTISRATVYNNLHALERDGEIRRITGECGTDRYDGSFIPHGHLFCTVCGQILDFEYPDFSKSLSDLISSDILSYELKVRYVCAMCKSNRISNKND